MFPDCSQPWRWTVLAVHASSSRFIWWCFMWHGGRARLFFQLLPWRPPSHLRASQSSSGVLAGQLGQPLPCGSMCFPPSLQPRCHRAPPHELHRDDNAQSHSNVLSLPAKMSSTSDVPKPSLHLFPQQLQTLFPPAQSGKGKDSSLKLASVGWSCALSPDNLLSSLKTQENIFLSLMALFFPQELLI